MTTDPRLVSITFPPFHGTARDVAERLRVMAACSGGGRDLRLTLTAAEARGLARFLDTAMTIAEGQQAGAFLSRAEAEARAVEMKARQDACSAEWAKASAGCDATLRRAWWLFLWSAVCLVSWLAGVIVAVLA